MVEQALIPERRNLLQRGMGFIQQLGGAAQGWNSLAGMFGGGAAGGAGGGGVGAGAVGAAAGKGLLGGQTVQPVTTGMSPVLGGGEAAGGTGAAAGESTVGSVLPYAGPAYAGYATYKDYKETGGAKTTRPAGEGSYNNSLTKWASKNGPTIATGGLNQIKGLGLSEDQNGSQMDAMERRYTTQQNAMQDLEDARQSLAQSGLPKEEQRRIGQKLALAQNQIGGRRNAGRTSYTTKA
jgi:hypothetical protein